MLEIFIPYKMFMHYLNILNTYFKKLRTIGFQFIVNSVTSLIIMLFIFRPTKLNSNICSIILFKCLNFKFPLMLNMIRTLEMQHCKWQMENKHYKIQLSKLLNRCFMLYICRQVLNEILVQSLKSLLLLFEKFI